MELTLSAFRVTRSPFEESSPGEIAGAEAASARRDLPRFVEGYDFGVQRLVKGKGKTALIDNGLVAGEQTQFYRENKDNQKQCNNWLAN
jgi:hypothetical protein